MGKQSKIADDIDSDASSSEFQFVDAVYVPRDEEGGTEHPLIQALPVFINANTILEAFPTFPCFRRSDRELPSNVRIQRVSQLSSYFDVLPCHSLLVDSVFRLITEGYLSRNPCDQHRQVLQTNYADSMGKKHAIPLLPFRPAHSPVITLTGISGVGKSTSLRRTLSFFPPVIRHQRMSQGSNLQVVWLMVDCPPDGSIKQLFRWILLEYDRLLGTHYDHEVGKAARLDQLMNKVAAVANYHHTGLIVIDEIQFAARGAARRGDPFMDFFVTFTNIARIPMIVSGTPQVRSLMTKSFRLARRVCDRGSLSFTNLTGDELKYFLAHLFKYQWVNKPVKLNEELGAEIVSLTQGINALIIREFQLAQILAIQDGSERITKALLQQVSKDWLGPVQPMLSALRSKKQGRIEQYNDLLIDALADIQEALSQEAEEARVATAREQRKQNQAQLSSVSDLVAMGVRQMDALKAVLDALNGNPALCGKDLTKAACEMVGMEFNHTLCEDEQPTLKDIVGDAQNAEEALRKLRLAGYAIGTREPVDTN
jgi:hypothetical protein